MAESRWSQTNTERYKYARLSNIWKQLDLLEIMDSLERISKDSKYRPDHRACVQEVLVSRKVPDLGIKPLTDLFKSVNGVKNSVEGFSDFC